MKKATLLLLALLLLFAFASCGDTPAKTSAPAETAVPTAEAPDLPDPASLDIGGDFHILVAGNWEWNDYAAENMEGTVVENAIYKRNETVKETYGVNITNEDVVAYSTAMGNGTGFRKIYMDYMAGESNYDAAMIGTYDVATLAYNGFLADLNRVPHIDLTKSYWDQRANADLSMNGKMYYTTGDISVADNRATYVLFFSKDMIRNYGLENPYDLVRKNEWTLDKFASLVKSVGTDENNDGVYDANDTFGLATPTDTHLAILSAAGERMATINGEGKIELTLYNQRVVDLYDAYLSMVSDHTHAYNYQYNYLTGKTGNVSDNETRVAMFDTGHILFYSHTMFYMDYLRDLKSDFGILPYPKYDAAQKQYGNMVSAWHSQFLCVPAVLDSPERTGIVLEEMAYLGKQLLTPAYYEKTLVGQYTRDEESGEMLDIIFQSLVYDIGVYYNIGGYKDKMTAMVRTGQSLTTLYEQYRTAAETKIEEINDFFAENTGA